MKPSVLVAEDDLSIQEMLRFVLRFHCHFDVAAEAADGLDALRLCESVRPDVLLTDLRLPRLDGVGLLHEIRARNLHVPIVFYTGTEHEGQLRDALAAQPDCFVHKHDPLSELDYALRAAVAGESYFSTTPARLRATTVPEPVAPANLSPEDRALLILLAKGESCETIAIALKKTPDAVTRDRERLMAALGVRDASGLAQAAIRLMSDK